MNFFDYEDKAWQVHFDEMRKCCANCAKKDCPDKELNFHNSACFEEEDIGIIRTEENLYETRL